MDLLAQSVVRFAPEKDYGPFVFQDDKGQVVGLSMDFLNAIKPSLTGRLEILPPRALSEILAAAQKGEVDLISSLRPTPERSEYLAFTPPYVKVPAVLVVRQNSHPPGLEDLAGMPVAVGKGYAVEAFVRQAYPSVQWHAVTDDATALMALQGGTVSAVVADIASVGFAVRQLQIKGLQIAGAVGFEYPLSFAYRKEQLELGRQLEAGLLALDPARRKALLDQWLDMPELQFEDPRRSLIRWAGMACIVMAVFWGLWRRSASRRQRN